MNDGEIIKGLQRMSNEDPDGFSSDVLALINRQQAEIERLDAESQVMRNATKVYTSEINCLREEIKNLETTLNSFVSPKNTEV